MTATNRPRTIPNDPSMPEGTRYGDKPNALVTMLRAAGIIVLATIVVATIVRWRRG